MTGLPNQPHYVPLHTWRSGYPDLVGGGTTSSDAQGTTPPIRCKSRYHYINKQSRNSTYVNDLYRHHRRFNYEQWNSFWLDAIRAYLYCPSLGRRQVSWCFLQYRGGGGTITPNCFAAYDDFACRTCRCAAASHHLPSNITVTTTNPSGRWLIYTVTVSGGCPRSRPTVCRPAGACSRSAPTPSFAAHGLLRPVQLLQLYGDGVAPPPEHHMPWQHHRDDSKSNR